MQQGALAALWSCWFADCSSSHAFLGGIGCLHQHALLAYCLVCVCHMLCVCPVLVDEPHTSLDAQQADVERFAGMGLPAYGLLDTLRTRDSFN